MSSSLGTRTWQGSIAFSWSYLQAAAGAGGQAQGARGEAGRLKVRSQLHPQGVEAVESTSWSCLPWQVPQTRVHLRRGHGCECVQGACKGLSGTAPLPLSAREGLLLKAFRSRAMTRGHFLCPTHPWSLSIQTLAPALTA